MNEPEADRNLIEQIVNALLQLLGSIPEPEETESVNPRKRARTVTNIAATKAAAVSAGLAVPPGPTGLLTILPDLMLVWKIQQQLVVDIAAIYGKHARVSQEEMLYCLFKHAAAQAVRDIVVRAGERVVVKRAGRRAMQKALEKIGVRLTQKAIGKGVARFLPVVGALGVGTYSFFDTRGVGKTARRLFSKDIEFEGTDDAHEM